MDAKTLALDATQNKGFLWNLMYENGLFENVHQQFVGDVKALFEGTIAKVGQGSHSETNLTALNKQVISEMMTSMQQFKDKVPNDKGHHVPVTAEEISTKRQEQFTKNVAKKKGDFDHHINSKKPTEIDFADDADSPIGGEMDNLVARAISKRENDLNVVLDRHDSSVGTAWINKDNDRDPEIPKELHIKIGDATPLADRSVTEVEAKRVTFTEPPTSEYSDSFLGMLKSVPVLEPSPDITMENRLDAIEASQREILGLLNKLAESYHQLSQ
jgi:hypothetical protein